MNSSTNTEQIWTNYELQKLYTQLFSMKEQLQRSIPQGTSTSFDILIREYPPLPKKGSEIKFHQLIAQQVPADFTALTKDEIALISIVPQRAFL
ncbi:uncharacterized protein MONOS_17723 [Monocercomonoides exilis]|uniref:uncharacterized protein n=1 Tax=Monocercomonoides exilis TaxID=2049356 RepID=UPI00355A567A|nr:hypothetical protein MONOS_17723 [Monocercomonoides exilis]